MKGFTAFVMTGMPQAVIAALGFALGSLFLPPLGVVSGAVLALVALRVGADKALMLLFILAAALMTLGLLLGQSLTLGLLFGLVQWAPVLLLAVVLRNSGSWQWVFQLVLLISLGTVLLAHLMIPDLAAYWLGVLEKHLMPLMQQVGFSEAQLEQDLPRMARLMTGMMAVSVMLSALLALMLGRSMQASLYNPGGFAEEFAELRVGRWPAVLLLLLVVGVTLIKIPLLAEALIIVLVLFFFQGLAVLHGLSRALQWPGGILVMAYVMLVLFFTPFSMLLAVTGVIDAFADIRKRLVNQSQ